MSRRVEVLLGEEARTLGVLYYNREGNRESANFEYDPEWLRARDRFAIDPALPLVAGRQFRKRPGREDSVFHGVIADTEPDGWGRRIILRDHAKRRHAARGAAHAGPEPVIDAVDFLLEVDDEARVGALRLRDEHGVLRRQADSDRRTTPPLIELPHLIAASHAVEMNTETAADLAYLRGRGTSLGGLRPKCSIRDDDGTLAIGKFPSAQDTRAVTKGEVLALQLAAAAGLNAAQARLVHSDGVPVAVIRRFDRVPGGRLLYCSAATMLQAEGSDATEHSYREIVDMLRRYGDTPVADMEELWRRIAFSILITNVDDHLHNHGLLHVSDGRWRLAPAFDVNPFPDRARELKTWITEETGPQASIEALYSAAAHFGLSPARSAELLGQVEAAVTGWRRQGAALGMTEAELDQFTDAFEHAERGAARRLASAAR
ncbi:MAG: type II toxin-antitoxin system HipA family toxin [bacterium]